MAEQSLLETSYFKKDRACFPQLPEASEENTRTAEKLYAIWK